MAWEQLVEKVKDIKQIFASPTGDMIILDYLMFTNNGEVIFCATGAFDFKTAHRFAKHRTPDQMYAIITALTETKE